MGERAKKKNYLKTDYYHCLPPTHEIPTTPAIKALTQTQHSKTEHNLPVKKDLCTWDGL